MRGEPSSVFLHKGPCPKCGSRDNLGRYSDGHAHCFGCSYHEPPTGGYQSTNRRPSMATDFKPIMGEAKALPKRGLTEETCRTFGYTVGTHSIKMEDEWVEVPVQVAPYYKDGQLVAQHLRTAQKDFPWKGTPKGAELFGQHLWRDGGKKVVITEGEIDAMSVSQLQSHKWPVVSVGGGSKGAKQSLKDNLEWLERFEEVILMFDMDQPGKDATAECAPLFTPGKCKVAHLPFKDANECLTKGAGGMVIEAIWGAKPYRPDDLATVDDVAEEAAQDVPMGVHWFLPKLTALTYGRRPGDLYGFGAGTGIGKTDFFTQSIAYDLLYEGLTVGVLYLEQPLVETVRRIAGKAVGKVLHVPGKATVEERAAAIKVIQEPGRLHFYRAFGGAKWETVKSKIRFMAVSLGCKAIYLDHLTALVSQEEDERKALDSIMDEMAALALELGIFIHYISHLTRPKDGPPHEEGGRVKQAHFRGSNAIGMWSHFLFGLERDQQHEDPEVASTTVLRCLKDRNTGQATGKLVYLGFDADRGMLLEKEAPAKESPFKDRPRKGSTNTPPWDDVPAHQEF